MVRAARSIDTFISEVPIRTPRRRRGFTIIELLVAIGIIAILSAILFPVFRNAREKACKIFIESNLKQIASIMLIFFEDHGVFPSEEQLGSSEYVSFIEWDGRRMLDTSKDFRYVIQSVDEATGSFTICAIPIPPYRSGSFVRCIRDSGETLEFFDGEPVEEAVADEEVRRQIAAKLALDTSARLLVKQPESASALRPLLALPETKAFVLTLVDRNGDEVITKEETLEFLAPAEGDPETIAEMKAGLRDIFFVLRLNDGDYEGVRFAEVQGDPAALYSPENWRLYIHSQVGHEGVAASLASKVDAAALARQRLNDPAARDACAAAIKAFRNELDAQVLKTIDLDAALKLDALIGIECPDDEPF